MVRPQGFVADGLYIRFLSRSAKIVPVDKLEAGLKAKGLDATLTLDAGTPEARDQLLPSHPGGPEIAVIERNPVKAGSLGEQEVKEFVDDIGGEQPTSAVDWLRQYLPKVKAIYAFQILSGTDVKNGWEAVHCVRDSLWPLGGIMQADGEGFSNEDGYHILWQFSDHVKGSWWMGVLKDGQWIHFQMELGNRRQREVFLRGEVPNGVKLAEDGA